MRPGELQLELAAVDLRPQPLQFGPRFAGYRLIALCLRQLQQFGGLRRLPPERRPRFHLFAEGRLLAQRLLGRLGVVPEGLLGRLAIEFG